MADSDKAPSSPPQILPSDLELINSFISGKKKSIATAHLQIEYVTNTIKLLDRRKVVVGVSKQLNEWQQKILLRRRSMYFGAIQDRLSHCGFFVIPNSGHPDFAEYHKYQTPTGFRLHYQPARSLAKSWIDSHSQSVRKQSNSILIFQVDNWYPIQELDIYQQTMRLRTLIGELVVGNEDLMIWIDRMPAAPEKIAPIQANSSPEPAVPPPSPPSTKAMPILTEDSSKSTELTSAFKTPIVTSGHQDSDETFDNLKNALRIKALAKLVDYLDNGETIVSTEVLKNGHSQIISTKTTEIKRNCPRWVIEQIKKF